MQIACKRFSCQKAVEVCYWACKHRRNCKDWHGALSGEPGANAITEQLQATAKKSGRVFDPQTMVLTSGAKKNRAAIVSKSPSAHLKSGGISVTRNIAGRGDTSEQILHNISKINLEEVKYTMTEANLDTTGPETAAAVEAPAEAPSKMVTAKPKPKPAAKPKPIAPSTGPVYLLLYPNGKYKELREADLNSEAADVLKDPSLRLVKGQPMIPQISFRTVED